MDICKLFSSNNESGVGGGVFVFVAITPRADAFAFVAAAVPAVDTLLTPKKSIFALVLRPHVPNLRGIISGFGELIDFLIVVVSAGAVAVVVR